MHHLHICLREAWEAACRVGEYRAESLETEGFIHCSTLEQVVGSANRYYFGRQDLLMLVIDPARLDSEIRFEVARNGQLYPHLYGPLPVAAVERVIEFPSQEDGSFRLPPSLAAEPDEMA